jgi:hypothetical protein
VTRRTRETPRQRTLDTQLLDDLGAIGLGPAVLAVRLSYTVTPGDPGYRYDANGDGCPPTGPEAELRSWTVDAVTNLDGSRLDVSADEQRQVIEWAAGEIERQWRTIECWMIEAAEREEEGE